jgi:hypothetical protein
MERYAGLIGLPVGPRNLTGMDVKSFDSREEGLASREPLNFITYHNG